MNSAYRYFVCSLVALAVTSLGARSQAALAPSKIEELKEKATDVLQITISKTTVNETKLGLGYMRKELSYDAVVSGVTRSASGTKAGDTISIHSYHLNGLTPPGPKNPPLLEKGWTGTVYLNKTEGGFRIAVFGHSFEPAD